MRLGTGFAVVVGAFVLAACGPLDDAPAPEESTTTIVPVSSSSTDSETTTSRAGTTTTGPSSEVGMPEMDQMVQAARTDLAARLDVADDEILVVRAEEVQWPNGALGCPEDGVSYTQALVDGAQILLRSGDRVFDYHAGSDGDVFLCASDEKDGGYGFVPPPGFND